MALKSELRIHQLSIPRQLSPAPMRIILARWIELALDVAIQRPHYTDAREHRRAAMRRYQDQGLHRRLPFRRFVLGLRELGDVFAGILKGDELATPTKRYRIVKWSFPAARRILFHG